MADESVITSANGVAPEVINEGEIPIATSKSEVGDSNVMETSQQKEIIDSIPLKNLQKNTDEVTEKNGVKGIVDGDENRKENASQVAGEVNEKNGVDVTAIETTVIKNEEKNGIDKTMADKKQIPTEINKESKMDGITNEEKHTIADSVDEKKIIEKENVESPTNEVTQKLNTENTMEIEKTEECNQKDASLDKEVEKSSENPEVSTEKQESDNPAESGAQAIATGNRCLAIKDYTGAIEAYCIACELLIPIYGELADEMGDVYFNYGRALLAHARSQSGVLGDKLEKVEGEDDDDDDDEEEDEEPEEDKDKVVPKTETNSEKDETVPELVDDGKKTDDAPDMAKEKETEENKTEEKIEENLDENADDLQLSWQFLDLSRIIFERKSAESKEIAIKLAEVYLNLGENGLEAESYDTAIIDMEACLKLLKEHLPEDDRRIAESLFQLGVAHSLNRDYDKAAKLFLESIVQLEKRITTLSSSSADESREINEIKEAIKEINEKVSDVKASEESLKTTLASKLVEGLPMHSEAGTSASPKASTSKSVTDISHLIRKKRKIDDAEEAPEEPVGEKKQKTA